MTTIRTCWTVLLVVGVLLTACSTGWSSPVEVQDIAEIDDEDDAIALCDYLLEDVSDEELDQLTGRGAEPGGVMYGTDSGFSCYVDANPDRGTRTEETDFAISDRGMTLRIAMRSFENQNPPEPHPDNIAPVEGDEALISLNIRGGDYPDLDETLAAQITQHVAQKINLNNREWPEPDPTDERRFSD